MEMEFRNKLVVFWHIVCKTTWYYLRAFTELDMIVNWNYAHLLKKTQ